MPRHARRRPLPAAEIVRDNIAAHDRVAGSYDETHPEIFNPREQARLAAALGRARDAVRSGGMRALDFGCGTGNLTRHLVDLGFDVVAADVTPGFLAMVAARYPVETVELPAGRLDVLPDAHFDLIGLYSVLHHLPDYLGVVAELCAKLRPGGVLFLDHEHHADYYRPTPALEAFRAANRPPPTGRFFDPEHKRWQYVLRALASPARHRVRWRRWRRIALEGDVHVFPDDHVDWDAVAARLERCGAEELERMAYLGYEPGYDEAAWERWAPVARDQSGMIARRRTDA